MLGRRTVLRTWNDFQGDDMSAGQNFGNGQAFVFEAPCADPNTYIYRVGNFVQLVKTPVLWVIHTIKLVVETELTCGLELVWIAVSKHHQ